MQNKLISSPALILGGSVILLLFLVPLTAKGAAFTQPPVPSYETVSSAELTTTAIIPQNLQNQWKKSYVLPAFSMITFSPKKPVQILEQVYFGKNTTIKQSTTFAYNLPEIYNWTKTIANSVNASAQEPKMVITNDRATSFTPPTVGKSLDRYNSALRIAKALEKNNTTIDLAVQTTQPSKKLGDLNNLGITELIGRGESKFGGSPANRRVNIKVGVQKMQGVIIKPGEEFSFNKYLGPVEADQGFKPELVIKASGTVPELGGGLCQVSSTTFRAAMHAGLPITQRKNHSYAVQYYAPQGTDATIYPGIIDLKFKNDTGNSILIWPYFKTPDYLVFDFYGTYDGREVTLNQPVVYDRKSDGSMKGSWTRTDTKNGQTKTDKFASVYQPPALFHKTETFVNNDGGTPQNPTPPTETPPTNTTPTTTIIQTPETTPEQNLDN